MASTKLNLEKVDEEDENLRQVSEMDDKNEEPSDPNTFVTGLAVDELKDDKTEALKHLDKLTDGIDEQFVRVLDNHQKDFMSAYFVSIFFNLFFISVYIGTHDQSQERIAISA